MIFFLKCLTYWKVIVFLFLNIYPSLSFPLVLFCIVIYLVHSYPYCVTWREVAQSCPTLCDPMDCNLPGSSIRGILQARVLEWVAISFPRRSSQPRDRTWVSHIAGRCFNIWATKEVACIKCDRNNQQESWGNHNISRHNIRIWF